MPRYKDVQALLICWKDALNTFSTQREALDNALKEHYGFETIILDIPPKDPDQFLNDNISSFMRSHDKDRNLLIIYYGGHGGIVEGQLVLKCFDKPEPYAEWQGSQFMKGTKADILIILDCCHAASAIKRVYKNQDNVVYLLTACSIEGKAPLRDGYSLTHKLTFLLSLPDFWEKPFRFPILYSRLVEHQLNLIVIGSDRRELGISPLFLPIVSRRETAHDIIIHTLDKDDDEGEEEEQERSKARKLEVKYADAATNTAETEIVVQPAHTLTKRRTSVSYTDAATNTETKLFAKTPTPLQPAPAPERVDVVIRQGVNLRGRVSNSPGSFRVSLEFTGNLRSRKQSGRMAIHVEDGDPQTEIWFERYMAFMNRWVRPHRDEDLEARKVAILSSGIKFEHKEMARLHDKGRLHLENFSAGHRDELDNTGHGTLCAAILGRLSKNTVICVAKIADSQGVSDPEIIAKAVDYATQEWKVDMIVFPLGFPSQVDVVHRAISRALQENIICLAAAGNAGANEQTAFPARMSRVIAVYSSDGYGNPSPFNPSPMKGRKNFSVLGESLALFWDDSGKIFKSGSSFAACVAAGILATMLELARTSLSLSDEDWSTLHTSEGAEMLLDLMSSQRGGYEYVAPWILLPRSMNEEEGRGMVKGQIVAGLRRLR